MDAREREREKGGEKWSNEKLFPVEEVRIGPTEVRNDRLKQVLLRDKPEVIRPRPKHFFPLLHRGKKVYPFQPRTVPFGRDYVPWTNIHPFSFNAFIYRPLLFLSTPSFSLPFLTPPTIPSSPLLYSPASFVRFVR